MRADRESSPHQEEPLAGPPPGLEVLFLNWRDRTHPQGGGSEVYVEQVAQGLALRGHRVTIFCGHHPGAPRDEITAAGVRIVRAGGRLSVYPRAALAYLSRRLGSPDVVVDVQNGVPFGTPIWRRGRVVVLCHHVHREQWRVVMGKIGAAIGWWLESKVSPRWYAGRPYVTVSTSSRDELTTLGVDASAISIIHNGTTPPPTTPAGRSTTPMICVLGRLVPHKRIELALDTLAELLPAHPDLRLVIAGRGWWHDELVAHAELLGLPPASVEWAGYVDEQRKHEILGASWVSLVPSLKEGWGLGVMEAAAHGTPSVAFHGAGGVTESVRDGETGLLVSSQAEFASAVERLLGDETLRARLGRASVTHAHGYGWEATVDRWEDLLERGTRSRRADAEVSERRTAG
jgi:glycosyltransferase involved in cell wall biosynthesis